MQIKRIFYSLILLLLWKPRKRTKYIKAHNILGAIGENSVWGPWQVPLYPKLIKIHNNVRVHKSVKIVTHDIVNPFLRKAYPDVDFGASEKLGCVEIMDNVYVGMNSVIMPDVRINKNCMISPGSVVTSDIPENSVVAGNPAKVIGRFDMYVALRKISKNQYVTLNNHELTADLAEKQWVKFEKRREKKPPNK